MEIVKLVLIEKKLVKLMKNLVKNLKKFLKNLVIINIIKYLHSFYISINGFYSWIILEDNDSENQKKIDKNGEDGNQNNKKAGTGVGGNNKNDKAGNDGDNKSENNKEGDDDANEETDNGNNNNKNKTNNINNINLETEGSGEEGSGEVDLKDSGEVDLKGSREVDLKSSGEVDLKGSGEVDLKSENNNLGGENLITVDLAGGLISKGEGDKLEGSGEGSGEELIKNFKKLEQNKAGSTEVSVQTTKSVPDTTASNAVASDQAPLSSNVANQGINEQPQRSPTGSRILRFQEMPNADPAVLQRSCFSADTLVKTVSGEKPMSELEVGDLVSF